MVRRPPRDRYADTDRARERDYGWRDPAPGGRRPPNGPPPSNPGGGGGGPNFDLTTLSVLAGVLVLGIGVGVGFTSISSGTNSGNVATREMIDASSPDPEICVQYGASAIAMDMRVFMTLNPFSVYVSQPVMQPGCVIRRNNWAVLEQQGAINGEQQRECKNRMNTFAYVGSIKSKPEVNCVYQNDAAQNLFVRGGADTKGLTDEADKF